MNDSFGIDQIIFIIGTARWTILLTVISALLGGAMGFVVALARASKVTLISAIAEVYIGTIQGIPVLIVLFLAYYGLSFFGLDLSPLFASVISLGLYASAYLGDIWRGSIQSVPKQQWEASASLALTRRQQYTHVILPQAIRLSLPPTVGFLVHLVKNTSIVSIVGYVELARAGQLVNNSTFQPFATFLVVGACYFVICYPLTQLSSHLERRLS